MIKETKVKLVPKEFREYKVKLELLVQPAQLDLQVQQEKLEPKEIQVPRVAKARKVRLAPQVQLELLVQQEYKVRKVTLVLKEIQVLKATRAIKVTLEQQVLRVQ